MDQDIALREAAVRHCRLLSERWGDAVPAAELGRGFVFQGERVLVVAWGRGIFKPKQLSDGPLTLVSSLAGTYADEHLEHDVMLYDYAPAASDEWANRGLKNLGQLGRPVILLKQVNESPSEYMIFAPVAILGADDHVRKFRLSLSKAAEEVEGVAAPQPTAFSKAYAETISKARLHQGHFRKTVLGAYGQKCCVCELRERVLLDAAHIVPDRLPDGVPIIQNGMAMCPTHHRAFDRDILDVTEDYRVQIQRDRLTHLDEQPTVRMLLDYDGKQIVLPRDQLKRPSPEHLKKKLLAQRLTEVLQRSGV